MSMGFWENREPGKTCVFFPLFLNMINKYNCSQNFWKLLEPGTLKDGKQKWWAKSNLMPAHLPHFRQNLKVLTRIY